jgi:hypothetical protein
MDAKKNLRHVYKQHFSYILNHSILAEFDFIRAKEFFLKKFSLGIKKRKHFMLISKKLNKMHEKNHTKMLSTKK